MKNILSAGELTSKLQAMKNDGFTQIKLPGGTSRDRQHYSGVIIPYYNPENRITYFLGLPYNPEFHKSGKEDNGNKKEGENPFQTAIREVMEETGLILTLEDFDEMKEVTVVVHDKINPELVLHTKHFFIAHNFSGEIFQFDGANPIDEETSAPIWIPARMFKEILWGGHQKAFQVSLEILAADRNILMSILDLFPGC